jgi:hypothetical protein
VRNGNRIGARRINGEQPMGATLRRTIDIAIRQKDHTLATRFDATCKVPRRDVTSMLDAAHPLYWQAVEMAQNVVSNDEREPAQKLIAYVEAMPDDVANAFASFIDLCASGAFMEGWVAGSIHCQEQRVTRKRTTRQRPGR